MNPKVVIVHDWLVGGGAELVVEQLHKMFPDAPIYTSYCTNEWRQRLDNKVVTGYLQHFGKIRKLLPLLRSWWFGHLNLSAYDLIISSSGAEAKFVKAKPGSKHVAYIHAPTHYYWDRYQEYLDHPGWGPFDWLGRLGLKIFVSPLRKLDFNAAQKPDLLIANSEFTKSKIKQYYQRDSVVVHPPMNIERFSSLAGNTERSGFVIAGRQTPYKKIDLAVVACTRLNLPLKVIGKGPDHNKLVKMAGPTIEFITNANDQQMVEYFAGCQAFIFPGVDDFGIVAVEALAAGTPVIAYKDGGALDYVADGQTGLFFEQPTTESLAATLKKFAGQKFDSKYISAQAARFSTDNFKNKMAQLLSKV